MSSTQRSLFVTLAAQAMSSVGFSVSILAWLWLTLVPPQKPELTEPILVDKKARRRSAPAALQSHKRNSVSSSAPYDDPSSTSSPPRTRRVYFLDDSVMPPPSRPTNQTERHDSSDLLDKQVHSSPTSEISPSSSSSTLVHTYTAIPPQTLETCRESALETDSSDSSPRTSLSLLRPLQKTSGRARTSSSPSDIIPIVTGPTTDNKQRRSSLGFTSPWSFRRASGSRNPASPVPPSATAASSASPTPVSVPSYFSRKTARRVSTPVPRTQPYAHPYYAQPPVEDEGYAAYLRGLPQFGPDSAITRSPTTSDSEEKEKDSPLSERRGRDRKANDIAQAALGLGRRPVQRLQQQRSASESWAAGQDPRL
ncbi:hypothetical protein C8R43DRAFT_1123784 [Mycena crocata]|nr:hypothetical protein C8R43DRAFT_1123784 [Mycena crocata]